jgi:hypothetical protein
MKGWKNKTCVKITTDGKITELSDITKDMNFMHIEHDGTGLQAPDFWKHKPYSLTMFIEYSKDKKFNALGTYLYNNLKRLNYFPGFEIYGDVYLMNEDIDDIVHFYIADLKYLMKMCKKLNKSYIM